LEGATARQKDLFGDFFQGMQLKLSARRTTQLYSSLAFVLFCNDIFTSSAAASPIPLLLVVLGVDDGILPLASRHMAIEEDVDLAVGSALHLWDVEVGKSETEECRACPNITTFSAEVSALYDFFVSDGLA
jgi:hypothetical protein